MHALRRRANGKRLRKEMRIAGKILRCMDAPGNRRARGGQCRFERQAFRSGFRDALNAECLQGLCMARLRVEACCIRAQMQNAVREARVLDACLADHCVEAVATVRRESGQGTCRARVAPREAFA